MAKKKGFSKGWTARFAVDGGITTGLCYGAFPNDPRIDMKEKVARAREGGNLTFMQVNSVGPYGEEFPEYTCALKIFDIWSEWNDSLEERGLYPTKVIIEDFEIRTNVMTRDVLASVRIANLLMGMMGISEEEGMEFLHLPKFYKAAQSKRFATNPRMKEWGFWEKGMGTAQLEHALDAARLVALDLAEERSGRA
jgi:hypothetical protein